GAKTSTKPLPGPASSSCLAASCLAKVTYRLPPMLWMPNGAKPAGTVGSVKLLTRWKLVSKTSMVPNRKLVAYRSLPAGVLTRASPLYSAPWSPARSVTVDRSTAMTARAGLGVALPVVQGGCPGVVVGHPDRQARAGGGAPGVPQVRVGVQGQAGDIGDQVGLPVGRAGDRTAGRGVRRQAGQAERAGGEEHHDGGGPDPVNECHHSPFGVAGSVEPAGAGGATGYRGRAPGQGLVRCHASVPSCDASGPAGRRRHRAQPTNTSSKRPMFTPRQEGRAANWTRVHKYG